MTRNLHALPPRTQDILKLAACLGSSFDLNRLALICERSAAEVVDDLRDALQKEVIVPLGDSYKYLSDDAAQTIDARFRFLHDRVQQAAYTMIDPEQRQCMHLSIGRLMRERLNPDEQAEHLIEIVRHLNEGRGKLADAAEKEHLARLNLQAGIKARNAAAYQAARQYIAIGLELLPANAWDAQYDLTLSLSREYAQSAYLAGEHQDAEQQIAGMLDRIRHTSEKLEVLCMQAVQALISGHLENAIQVGIKALALTGIRLSEKPHSMSILREALLTRFLRGRRKIADLIELPALADPEKKIALKLLLELCPAAFLTGNDNLWTLAILKMTNLSLRYGNAPASALAYIGYGGLSCTTRRRLKSGYEFGKLALAVNERFRDTQSEGSLLTRYGIFIHQWNEHWRTLTPLFRKSMEASYQAGDLLSLSFNGVHAVQWDPTLDLETKCAEMEKYRAMIQKANYQNALDEISMARQVLLNLRGLTVNRFSISDASFDEVRCLEGLKERQYIGGITIYYYHKAELCACYEAYAEALKYLKEGEKSIQSIMGTPWTVKYAFLTFLALAGGYAGLSVTDQKLARKRLNKEYRQMKIWAGHCPVNFQHLALIMAAELARLTNKPYQAAALYDQAIRAARTHEWLGDEALANTRAAEFHCCRAEETIASVYMGAARDLYARWGAVRKVEFLEERYPRLLMRGQVAPVSAPSVPSKFSADSTAPTSLTLTETPSTTLTTRQTASIFDFETVIKAAQTISGQIVLADLLHHMMRIVMQNSGADRAFFLMETGGELCIEAEAGTGTEKTLVLQSRPLSDAARGHALAAGIVNYVARTHDNIVLDHACDHGDFMDEAAIKARRVKSVLCAPVLGRGKLNGIIYLENNMSVGAFTPERVKLLQVLASQTAISIENARIYHDLEVSEAQYRSLYEGAIEGIFQTTPAGRFISANPALCTILGYTSADELMAAVTNFPEQLYVDAQDHAAFLAVLRREGETRGFETRMYRQDRRIIFVALASRLVQDAQGQGLHLEGSLVDITERIRKEQAERKQEIAEAVNRKIMDSIRYAERIQRSILPNPEDVKALLPNSFFLWLPRDVVGGDLYCVEAFDNGVIVAVIDCTGHGVPGAFMTMIASSALRRIIRDEGCHAPGTILKRLNRLVKTGLQQDTEHALSDDGMDAAVCVVTPRARTLTFAGAKLPLLYIQDGEAHIIQGDRKDIGYKRSDLNFDFQEHTIVPGKGSAFYLYSDGIVDQFGGQARARSFGTRRFKTLLLENAALPLAQQRDILLQAFEAYRGEHERMDDVTVVGFRVDV